MAIKILVHYKYLIGCALSTDFEYFYPQITLEQSVLYFQEKLNLILLDKQF
jgi:hypothetical protein